MLLLVVAILVPFLVPVDRFRPLIVRLAEAGTGRTVAVGALRLHVVPNVHLEVVNLHVKNPAGFPLGDTLAIKSVDVSTTISSLLARRLDVTRLSFNGVEVNLLQTAGGKTNYDFPDQLGNLGTAGPAAGRNAPAGSGFALNRIDVVTVRQVKITMGTYDPRAGRVAPRLAINGFSIRVSGIHVGAPNWVDSVSIATNLRGVTVSSPALSKPLQIQQGSINVTAGAVNGTLTVALGTLRASGTFKIANLKDPVADFDVSIPQLDVASLGTLGAAGGLVTAPAVGQRGPRRLLARGRIRIGEVVAKPVNAKTVAGQITVYTDRTEINAVSLSAFGGTVQGTGLMDYGAGQRAAATFQARSLDLSVAMRALGLATQPGLGGRLDADGRVASSTRDG